MIRRWQKMVWILTLLLFTTSACKQQQATRTSDQKPSPSPLSMTAITGPSPIIGKPYPATGVVKVINLKEGWIEIDHEEIAGLMPAMEMEWPVQKKSLLNNVKVGDKVNFTVVETGKGEIITELKRASKNK